MTWSPEFQRADEAAGRVEVRLGHPVVDLYLEFLAARCRPNTVLAAGFDLKVFFALFPVEPTEVTTADVLAFITAQRASGDDTVVRLVDGESGLSARTIQRRLSSLSSMFSYLIVRGDVDQNPVPARSVDASVTRPWPARCAVDPHTANAASGGGAGRCRCPAFGVSSVA